MFKRVFFGSAGLAAVGITAINANSTDTISLGNTHQIFGIGGDQATQAQQNEIKLKVDHYDHLLGPSRFSGKATGYTDQGLKLELVQLLHRHGARTACGTRLPARYPTNWTCAEELNAVRLVDIDSDRGGAFRVVVHENKTGGCYDGQLTELGRRQTLKLGTALREHYVKKLGFLSEYHPALVQVRTTQIQRVIDSTENVLVSLFPSHLNSVPYVIPIVTMHRTQETMYAPNSKVCPRLGELQKAFNLSMDFAEKFEKPAAELRQRFSEALDIPIEQLPSVHGLYDDLYCRHAHGFPLPGKVTPSMVDEAERLCYYQWFAGFQGASIEAQRLAIGRFVGELADGLNSIVDPAAVKKHKSMPTTKLMVYGGHDTTVGPLMFALGIQDGKWPGFASNIALELFSEESKTPQQKNYYVRVLYNGDATKPTICEGHTRKGSNGELCEFKAFMEALQRLTPVDYKDECKRKADKVIE